MPKRSWKNCQKSISFLLRAEMERRRKTIDQLPNPENPWLFLVMPTRHIPRLKWFLFRFLGISSSPKVADLHIGGRDGIRGRGIFRFGSGFFGSGFRFAFDAGFGWFVPIPESDEIGYLRRHFGRISHSNRISGRFSGWFLSLPLREMEKSRFFFLSLSDHRERY